MTRRQWWYLDSSDQKMKGPVDDEVFRGLVDGGTIDLNTLVWQEGMPDWAPLSATGFPSVGGGEAVKPDEVIVPPPPEDYPSMREPRHPWRRFFARHIDITLAILVLMSMQVGMLMGLAWILWIPLEALLLSRWGYTPGKRLFNVTVRRADGALLTFEEALRRTLRVWFFGLGLGLPIVQFITMGFAYHRLTTKGITSWDATENLRVTFTPLSVIQMVILTALVIFLLLGFSTLIVIISELSRTVNTGAPVGMVI